MNTRRVAVVGGNRIPFARSNTVYSTASNQDMLTAAIDGLVSRYGLEGERLGIFFLSGGMGESFALAAREMTERIQRLGPSRLRNGGRE